jgi:hypothetical protein
MANTPISRLVHDGISHFLKVVLVGYALFQLYTSYFGMLEPLVQRGVFLGPGHRLDLSCSRP